MDEDHTRTYMRRRRTGRSNERSRKGCTGNRTILWNRRLDPEARLLKDDEDLIAFILTSEEDVARLEGMLVRWRKGTKVKTANLKRPKQVIPINDI